MRYDAGDIFPGEWEQRGVDETHYRILVSDVRREGAHVYYVYQWLAPDAMASGDAKSAKQRIDSDFGFTPCAPVIEEVPA